MFLTINSFGFAADKCFPNFIIYPSNSDGVNFNDSNDVI